jgi:acyl carrier protein
MSEAEIYETLTPIFRDVFVRDDLVLRADLTAQDIADWDSFKQIEIIIAVQEHYGIKFRTRELDTLNNVGDLVSLIAVKT